MSINIFGIKFNINKEYIILAAVLAVIVAALIGYRIVQSRGDIIIDTKADFKEGINVKISEKGNTKETSEPKEEDLISVHVTGCVNNPGVVTIKRGSIIKDAIDAAGGATEDADLENINLVYKLNYNVKIKIRAKGEVSGETETSLAGKGVDIIDNSGGAVEEVKRSDGKININSATVEELMELPGIGEKTAADIIKYREQAGGFRTIEDIMNVPGIKEGRFEKIRDKICTE